MTSPPQVTTPAHCCLPAAFKLDISFPELGLHSVDLAYTIARSTPRALQALGVITDIPEAGNCCIGLSDSLHLLWIGPDYWLWVDRVSPSSATTGINVDRKDLVLLDAHAQFVAIDVSGKHASALLSTACSVDLREQAFPLGMATRTRYADVPVIVFRTPICKDFVVLVERPLVEHLANLLNYAAQEFR